LLGQKEWGEKKSGGKFRETQTRDAGGNFPKKKGISIFPIAFVAKYKDE
jgi:hypothetical protein